ncbi:22566_t:CDS:2 [Gigaspora margarita]|uniref:22566_t:CDS:1 n=1 Tax=Gigaspora margarita TaxID=4874 RepID=A0ABN7UL98_GIGMA|nr:22566_t:CDS:2 [Gigaspora margarita]
MESYKTITTSSINYNNGSKEIKNEAQTKQFNTNFEEYEKDILAI